MSPMPIQWMIVAVRQWDCIRIASILMFLSIASLSHRVVGDSPVTAIHWSESDGKLLALKTSKLEIIAPDTLTVLQSLPLSMNHGYCLRLSPTGNKLGIAGGSPGENGSVQIWSYPELTMQSDITPHTDVVQSICWTRDSSQIGTASWDKTCKILDLQGKTLQVYRGHSNVVQDILFLPDSVHAASCSIDHSIQIWNRETGETIKNFPNHTASVDALALYVDPAESMAIRLSSISQDRTLRFWQPMTGRMIRFHRFEEVPCAAQWRSDGQHIDVVCESGEVYSVEFESLQVKLLGKSMIGHVYAMTRDAKSKRLWVGGERGIQVFATDH